MNEHERMSHSAERACEANKTERTPLSPDKQRLLAADEGILVAFGKTSLEAGGALQRIRDGKHYPSEFKNFETYCREKWGWSRDTADRRIGAWRVANLLTPIGVNVGCASQVRSLIAMTDEQVLAVGRRALELAGADALTAKHFSMAAAELKPTVPKRPVLDRRRKAVSAAALKFVRLAEQAAHADDKSTLLKTLQDLKALLLEGAIAMGGGGKSEAFPDSTPVVTSDSPPPASPAIPSNELSANGHPTADGPIQQFGNPVEAGSQAPKTPANDPKVESEEDEQDALECTECGATFSDEEEAVTIYECGECGTRFTRDESAAGNHQCPDCNRFGHKVTDLGCPECHDAELQETER